MSGMKSLKRAFVRSIEVLGEATKKLPEDIKAMQPDIEWRKVSGMRYRLIHDVTIQGGRINGLQSLREHFFSPQRTLRRRREIFFLLCGEMPQSKRHQPRRES